MTSDEKQLDPMTDTLNPDPSKFGLPWWCILGIVTVSVIVFMFPGCKLFGLLLCPTALAFGYWLCHKDPQEPALILHEIALPAEFDPGK